MRKYIRTSILNALAGGMLIVLFLFIPEQSQAMQDADKNETAVVHAMTFNQLQDRFYKQEIKEEISLELNQVTLQKALAEIAQKTGLKLSYRGDVLADKRVTLQRENISVSDALAFVLEGTVLDYKFSEDGYLLIARDEGLIENLIYQQTIGGTVLDARTREALPGVNIAVKGTTIGASTDLDGSFEFNVPSLQDTLVISYIGYITQEISIEDRTVLDVLLQQQTIIGQELVVVGYGTREARDITGSVGSVSAEEITQVVATNPAQAMQGRIPGVTISQNSWEPGANSTIRIRGSRSIGASNDPLYVVDGTPLSSGAAVLNDINPTDIQSIEVLKDASATAIYGSRGANGVILITTKRPATDRTSINYSTYQGIQAPLNEPRIFTAGEYAEYMRDAHRSSTVLPYTSSVPDYDLDGLIPQFAQDPYVLESVRLGYDENGTWHPDRVRGFDWNDAISQTGYIQNQQISVSRGTEDMSVLISGGYHGIDGIVQGTGYERYNLRANFDYDVNERIRLSSSTMLSSSEQNRRDNLYAGAREANPLGRPMDDDGEWIYFIGNDPLQENPLLDIDGHQDESKQLRLMSNLNLVVDLFDGLSYRGVLGYSYRTERDGGFRSSNSRGRVGASADASYLGLAARDLLIENMLTYQTILQGGHEFDFTVAGTFEQFNTETYGLSVEDLPYEQQLFHNLGSGGAITNYSSSLSESRIVSGMGRVNYTLLDRYLFTVTGRYDGASVLAEGSKFAFFPSAAFGWRLSDESFLQKAEFLNDLKLRVSYGITGNSAVNPYQTLGSLEMFRYAFGEDVVLAFGPGSIPNSDLKWETTKQANIGLDFGIFNHRISGSVDVYRANTSDLLLERVLPVVSGFQSILSNIGKTRNTGLELSLSTVNLGHTRQFRWNTDFVFSTNKNEIVELLFKDEDDIGNQWFVGHPIDVIYDLEFNGIWQEGDQAEMDKFNANGHSYEPGLIRVKDQNGDYRIDSDDRTILGSERPKWTVGFTNNFFYKNFDLSFQVYASYGAYGTFNNFGSFNGRYNMSKVNYWTPENQSNDYPKANYDIILHEHFEALFYRDASFVRLKYITLGYDMPVELINRIFGANRFRVYVSAQNPILITNFPGPDPEGAQNVSTPSPKTFMAGIELSF